MHLHVMLNQMGIKEGIRKFGEKGNDVLLKELNQEKFTIAIIYKLKKFGQDSPLVTSWGKVLEYLGMCIGYTTKVIVKISMYEYIDKMNCYLT